MRALGGGGATDPSDAGGDDDQEACMMLGKKPSSAGFIETSRRLFRMSEVWISEAVFHCLHRMSSEL